MVKDLVATNKLGHTISLKRLRVADCSKIIGVWMIMDSNHYKLVKELKLAVVEWGVKVRNGNFSRKESWQALHSNISTKLKYPLTACTLSI